MKRIRVPSPSRSTIHPALDREFVADLEEFAPPEPVKRQKPQRSYSLSATIGERIAAHGNSFYKKGK